MVSPNGHQTSFSKLPEHTNRFLHETFEMFLHVVTITVTIKFIDDVNFFMGGRNLEALCIQSLRPSLCKQKKFVYQTRLFKSSYFIFLKYLVSRNFFKSVVLFWFYRLFILVRFYSNEFYQYCKVLQYKHLVSFYFRLLRHFIF